MAGLNRILQLSVAGILVVAGLSSMPPGVAASGELTSPGGQPNTVAGPGIETGERNIRLSNSIFLRRTMGNLTVQGDDSGDTCEVYIHVPVAYADQVPLKLSVIGSNVIDYRFLKAEPPNMVMVVSMVQAPSMSLAWSAGVAIKENDWDDLPLTAPIPTLADLPDSVLPYLQPTDCSQVNLPIVQEIAVPMMLGADYLVQLATNIAWYAAAIPYEFPHTPLSFDAFYALTWGSSCTGTAHGAVALLRACNIPARPMLCITKFGSYMDHHWVVEYFVPGYGWVRMEPTMGYGTGSTANEVVTWRCEPHDEFPLFWPMAIEAFFHSSAAGIEVDWGASHRTLDAGNVAGEPELIESVIATAARVWSLYTDYQGVALSDEQAIHFAAGIAARDQAFSALYSSSDVVACAEAIELALDHFLLIAIEPWETILSTDFENGAEGWTHGGNFDEWELGTPTSGPSFAHSGSSVWGTDLDSEYEICARNWLLSAPIDLTGYSCASCRFSIWASLVDRSMTETADRLEVDVFVNGTEFLPLCSEIYGGNDDPVIPKVGGWSRVELDLSRHVGQFVQIRFRFVSGNDDVDLGCYIDDLLVQGRPVAPVVAVDDQPGSDDPIHPGESPLLGEMKLLGASPNPFNPQTSISFAVSQRQHVSISVYDLTGKLVSTLTDQWYDAGNHSVEWRGSDLTGGALPSGTYLVRMRSGQ